MGRGPYVASKDSFMSLMMCIHWYKSSESSTDKVGPDTAGKCRGRAFMVFDRYMPLLCSGSGNSIFALQCFEQHSSVPIAPALAQGIFLISISSVQNPRSLGGANLVRHRRRPMRSTLAAPHRGTCMTRILQVQIPGISDAAESYFPYSSIVKKNLIYATPSGEIRLGQIKRKSGRPAGGLGTIMILADLRTKSFKMLAYLRPLSNIFNHSTEGTELHEFHFVGDEIHLSSTKTMKYFSLGSDFIQAIPIQ
ncbi:hypothetical protein GGX14DRAFT_404867 [Mycena pura]|uniref:Uncharacterized protein n=1 Tax=Mycena pura TaxID=153505 RepID=A0AAD6UTR9_9AGAR|nr:hypothetical protein GGX14DRAFT_404867 [Mycena pura]